jgi:hypothetical protein
MNPVVVLFVVGLAWALIISLLVRPEDVSGAVRRGAAKDGRREEARSQCPECEIYIRSCLSLKRLYTHVHTHMLPQIHTYIRSCLSSKRLSLSSRRERQAERDTRCV